MPRPPLCALHRLIAGIEYSCSSTTPRLFACQSCCNVLFLEYLISRAVLLCRLKIRALRRALHRLHLQSLDATLAFSDCQGSRVLPPTQKEARRRRILPPVKKPPRPPAKKKGKNLRKARKAVFSRGKRKERKFFPAGFRGKKRLMGGIRFFRPQRRRADKFRTKNEGLN